MKFYGRNVTLEALHSELHASQNLFIQDNIKKDKKVEEIIELARARNIPIQRVSTKHLQKLFSSDEHQGVGIEVSFSYQKASSLTKLNSLIYISEVTYEHNIGAIIRSAEVAGIQGIVLPKDTAITPVAGRTSAGAIFHVPIFKESIYNTLKTVQKSGYTIIGIERDGEPYFEINLLGNVLFIIGGENKSLSKKIRESCDHIAEIPQSGRVNSLNMSVATSIILFERVRQNYY